MVYYSRRIPSGHDFLGIFKVLFRWKGSIYKIIYKDVLIYLIIYFAINLSYRFAMKEQQKRDFEDIILYLGKWGKSPPTVFVLGFFVSQVLSRWWNLFGLVPWMNSVAFMMQGMVLTGKQPAVARKIRLTAVRYLNLAWLLTFQQISVTIQERCHDLDVEYRKKNGINESPNPETRDPVEQISYELNCLNDDPQIKEHFGRIISPSEIEAFQNLAKGQAEAGNKAYTAASDYWVPLQWCIRLLKKASTHGFIVQDRNYLEMVRAVNGLRGQLGSLLLYADANVPLVYTQVVIIAVYTFFMTHILDQQFISPPKLLAELAPNATAAQRAEASSDISRYDYYFPIFSVLNLIFIVGWMRVAMILLNPLGSDDNDFPLSDIFDYNMMISSKSAGNHPDLYPKKLKENFIENEDADLMTLHNTYDSDDEDAAA